MGVPVRTYLASPNVYTCTTCHTHICEAEGIISRTFQGRRGRAYLFSECVNVKLDKPVSRSLMTGMHVVCDSLCAGCGTVIGWKYIHAEDEEQRYKIGKFIVERECIDREDGWEEF